MDAHSRLGIEPQVYVGGQLMPWRCTRVVQSAGGHNLDMAELELDIAVDQDGQVLPKGDPLHDFRACGILQGKTNTVICQVAIPEGPIQRVIHHGRVTGTDITLDGRAAEIRYTSRTEPWMFGVPIRGSTAITDREDEDAQVYLPGDVVFNPTLDGRSWGNMLRHEKWGARFVHPGQMQSDVALRGLGFDPDQREPLLDEEGNELPQFGAEYWRLSEAVIWLRNYNWTEFYILRPAPEVIRGVFEVEGEDPILKNVVVKRGWWLPQALDHVLLPHGYSWKLLYGPLGEKPTIEIFKLGKGFPLAVGHQRHGERYDPRLTTMRSMRLHYDASNRFIYRAEAYGSPLVVEGTWELVRAWDHSLSTTDPEELRKSSERYQTDPEIRRVGRDFVLNEAGDYAETNQPPEPTEEGEDPKDAAPPESPNPAVEEVLGRKRQRIPNRQEEKQDYVPRRRRFGPCLTTNQDGAPIGNYNGVEIEYSLDNGQTWQPIIPGGDDPCAEAQPIVLLDREAGIRFEGEYPALLFLELGGKAKVRITASLVADAELVAFAEATMWVPHDVEQIIHLPQYQWRVVDESSIYSERVRANELTSHETNDVLQAWAFAHAFAEEWNHYDCDGHVVLDGCDRVADVGYMIPAINGRNIDLTVDDAGRAPQVMAVVYDFNRQETILQLGTPVQEVRPQ